MALRVAAPTVPVGYAVLAMEIAEERGVQRELLLQAIDMPSALLDQPEARLPLIALGRIIARSMRYTGDVGLGILFGLRSTLTSHGFMGLGVMSQATLREALEFKMRYLTALRFPAISAHLFVEDTQAVIDLRDAISFGPIRRYAFEALLIFFTHVLRVCMPATEMQLWFEWPEPDYYVDYRGRLPPTRFRTGVNQLRFPARYLERALDTANPRTAQLVTEHCDREIALLGPREDTLEQVRVVLANTQGRYPDLEAMAARMCMSSRTLKRKLAQHRLTYKRLIGEERHRHSIGLLADPALNIERVAERLGYSASANFCRAFQRWAGVTPTTYRTRMAAEAGEVSTKFRSAAAAVLK